MLHLLDPDKRMAGMTALISLADSADQILADRAESGDTTHKALEASMAIAWAADLTEAVGSARICRLLQAMRKEHFAMEEYEPPREMLIRATDEKAPILHTQWVVCGEADNAVSPFRNHGHRKLDGGQLFDSARATFGCLAGIPFNQLIAAEWELPQPDMRV